MACLNEHPNYKHYCKVCKKGFMCGRALGGHMRAHGIGDESGNVDDDDNGSDWEEKYGGDRNNSSKRMYQLRTNPNRLKSCRTCENCGKEFLSWKSFLEHGNGKCSSDDASESIVSSPESEDGGSRRGGGWSKRKRSLRSKIGSLSEEDDLLLATCLMQLANTVVDVEPEPEESCASASKEEERRNSSKSRAALAKGASSPRGLFECKACKKVFNSHQALGGHRASHKKVKGCFAAKQDEPDDFFQFEQPQPQPQPLVGAARRKSKVHECSICHRVFNSGQALGGHKRCHWIISNTSPETSKFQFQDKHHHHKPPCAEVESSEKLLDLNVPAWARNPLSFEVSTDMRLQPWIGHHSAMNNNERKADHVNYVDDEAHSNLKLAKLTHDLNDTNVGSSQWLQVGIGSTPTQAAAAAATTTGDA